MYNEFKLYRSKGLEESDLDKKLSQTMVCSCLLTCFSLNFRSLVLYRQFLIIWMIKIFFKNSMENC